MLPTLDQACFDTITTYMPEALVLDMPTDLHSTAPRASSFELEGDIRNKENPRGLTALTVDIPGANKAQRNDTPRPLPLWRTPEFLFYYLVAVVVIPLMVWVPVSLSSRASHAYRY